MGAVARHLLGEPNKALSSGTELRYGQHGSLKINLTQGLFHDFETDEKGGVVKLLQLRGGVEAAAVPAWFKDQLGIDIKDGAQQIVATYPYTDENGDLLYEVVRKEPKTFLQRRPDGRGGWIWKLDGVRHVPFHLQKLLGRGERAVFVCEGEKDVLTLEALGQIATTNSGGAGKWRDEYAAYFKGADVVICPHNDEAGRGHTAKVMASLVAVASRVRVLRLPGLPDKEDVSWWRAHGGTAEKLLGLLDDLDAPGGMAEAPGQPPGQSHDPVVDSLAFTRALMVPDYLLDGILQRGFLYALTAATGAGKTALALRLLACAALGRPFGNRECQRVKCLMFAGENPDDIRMRWIALSYYMGFHVEDIDVWFVPGVHSMAGIVHIVKRFAEAVGGLGFVSIDTSAAYFEGEDENSNKELGDYARFLRLNLCTLPGRPCVLVNCHPIKHATTQDQLLPRGGGAFIAEVDGNLTAMKTDKIVEVHWTGKLRGADFEPLSFELLSETAPPLKDSRGRQVYTVICREVAEEQKQAKQEKTYSEAEQVLRALVGGADTIRAIAEELKWVGAGGNPHTRKVHKLMKVLEKEKLVKLEMGHWKHTEKAAKAWKKKGNGHV